MYLLEIKTGKQQGGLSGRSRKFYTFFTFCGGLTIRDVSFPVLAGGAVPVPVFPGG
jgi:hypothetical protein